MQNILIVEDHIDAKMAMIDILNMAYPNCSLQAALTFEEAKSKVETQHFDLVVLDLGLPDGNGEDLIEIIHAHLPNAYVVISTIHDESDRLLAALKNGANGYLLKEQPRENLVEEFKSILKGKPPLAPAITRRILEYVRDEIEKPSGELENGHKDKELFLVDFDHELADQLTEREKEILSLMGKGFNRPEIAGILDISKHTVATHIGNVYSKLEITTRSEAALIARHLNLI